MFKVFLVEDNGAERENLRKNIPWEEYGFTCIGDAPDGEAALPMIRRQPPDLLFTDIEMPFMDGLALSQRVRQEFPETKIVLFSSAADFAYARRAIDIGVERYLCKPLTGEAVAEALADVRDKLLAGEAQRNSNEQLWQEKEEYEWFCNCLFFEKLVTGSSTVEEIYNEAQKLGLDLDAQGYNIVLCYTAKRVASPDRRAVGRLSEAQKEIEALLRRCPQFLLFRWSLTVTAVLIKAEEAHAETETELCITGLCRCLADVGDEVEWCLAAGSPVQRLSALCRSFQEASEILSYRHLCPGQHVLTRDSLAPLCHADTERQLKQLDSCAPTPEILQSFLKSGREEEVSAFVAWYLDEVGKETLTSVLLSQYLMLNVRFTAVAFVQSLGYDPEELTSALDGLPPVEQLFGEEAVERYLTRLLIRAVALRESSSLTQHHAVIRQGLRYIDQHYTRSGLTLGEVAANSQISANYFSALFRKEMGCTFVDYLTQKRMDRAKELLRDSSQRTGKIALAVGYRDAHYFSTLFHKTQGCTPREYRAQRGRDG
ncbi:MAG: response regulator [Clostridiales bacterium]|nr:response regulator [Clostridiales bacterium]